PSTRGYAPLAAAAARSPMAIDPQRLKVISDLLLPTSVRSALAASGSERLLVLPAADFSTVPFAALPIDGRALIDVASIVMLTGTDELVTPVKREVWSRRFGDPSLSRLIVGDPDARTDKLKWAPLPGARAEASAVASLLEKMPGEMLLGAGATTDAVKKA